MYHDRVPCINWALELHAWHAWHHHCCTTMIACLQGAGVRGDMHLYALMVV